jgi:hypothetical protein
VLVHPRASGDHGRFGLGDVRDRQIEVHLLRVTTAGPGRLDPVIDALESERGVAVGIVRADPPSGGASVAKSRLELSSIVQPRTSA